MAASTRERILQEGLAMMSQVGLGGITLGVLADRLEMSKSGLFAHFRSKEQVQIDLLQHMAEFATAHVVQPAMSAEEGLPRLQLLVRNWFGWAQRAGLPGGCMPRILLATLLAGCFAFVIDVLLGVAGLRFTQVPKGFPPFTLLPIFAGTFGGAVLASVAYAITQAVWKQPERTFLFVAIAVLALSFSLPLRLSFTKSHRFAGVTPTAQMMLVLMHTVVATVSVAALLAKPNQ